MDSSLNRKVPLKWSSCIYILVLKSNYKKNSLWYFENKERSLCLGKHKKKPCFHFADIGKEKILGKATARTHCSENISQASYFDYQKNFYNVHPNFPAAETCIIRKRTIKRIYVGSLTYCCLIILLDVIFKTSVIVFFHNFSPPEKSFNYKGVFMSIYASFYPQWNVGRHFWRGFNNILRKFSIRATVFQKICQSNLRNWLK